MAYGYILNDTGMTFEVWFRRDAVPSGDSYVVSQQTQANVNWPGFSKGITGRHWAVYFGTTTGAIKVSVYNKGTSTTAGPSTLLLTDPSPSGYPSDNQWHHLAVTQGTDRRTWTVYLDGEQLMTGLASVASNWDSGRVTLGGTYAPQLGNYGIALWDKDLSNAALYTKPLTASRIADHYSAGAGNSVYYGDDETERLERIANWANVPEQSREFESPLVELQGVQVKGVNALNVAQSTVKDAGGIVFADGQSRVVYHNRKHRYNRWTVATLSESAGSAPEMDMTFTVDDAKVFNDITGSRPYGSSIRLQDAVSKASYGWKPYEITLSVTSHEELRNAVSWLLTQYGTDRVRISAVSFSAETSYALEWLATGGVQIGDVITLDEMPPPAPLPAMSFFVEAIDLDASYVDGRWTLTLALSPYEINKVFEVGTSNLGGGYVIAF